MLANFNNIPQKLIKAIIDSNAARQDFLADEIIKKNPRCVGVHTLSMKKSSENFKSSSVLGIIKKIKKADIEIIIYEPTIKKKEYMGIKVINDFSLFKRKADLILSNRISSKTKGLRRNIFSRDIFNIN